MKSRSWFLVHLALGLGWCLTPPVAAQPAPAAPSFPSHLPLDNTPINPQDAKQLLQQRLHTAKNVHDLDEVVAKLLKNVDPKTLDPQLRRQFQNLANQPNGKPIDFSKPEYADLIKKLPDLKDSGLKPEDLKALARMANQQAQGQPVDWQGHPDLAAVVHKLFERNKADIGEQDPSLDLTGLENRLQALRPQRPVGPIGGPPLNPLGGPPMTNPPDSHQPPPHTPPLSPIGMKPGPTLPHAPSAAKPPAPEVQTWLAKKLVKLAVALHLDEGDKDSLAAKFVTIFKADDETGEGANTLSNVGEYLPSDKINSLSSWFSHLRLPSMPSAGSVVPPSPNLGSPGLGGGAESAVHVLIGTLVVVLAGVVVWKLMGAKGGGGAGENPWHVGAWPVQPGAVRSRADLIKAFEYLAVLLLGPSARTHHHLELAEELGEQARTADPTRSEAARTLAYLYELARYTPAEETLPPDELATARRELTFLAGAAPA
jgi:hypothetical protein